MEQFSVTGMSCAACSARVEKAVANVDGVTSCSVSLLTNSMGVEGTASEQAIIKAVEAAGYGAAKKGESRQGSQAEGADSLLKDRETPLLRKRLLSSLGFLAVLMYLSMGHMMWNWPVPSFLAGNHVAMGLTQLLLTVAVMVANQKFFVSGFKSLLHRFPNMDTLVALGSGAAFVYSTYALFAMTDAQMKGDLEGVMAYMHEFYFESAAMILTLITVGKMLEARSKGRTTDALKSLMKLAPKTATVLRGSKEEEVPIEQVKKGRCVCGPSRGKYPSGWDCAGGQQRSQRGGLDGGKHPMRQNGGGCSFGGYHEPVRFFKMRGFQGWGGYYVIPDYPDGKRCGGNKSAYCKGGG